MNKLLVVVITCGVTVFSRLPPYIPKCSVKDPNINTCALNNAKQTLPHLIKGDRQVKIPALDPLFLPQFRLVAHGLDASLQNSTIVGLGDIILEKVGFDFDKKDVTFQGNVPHLNFTGSYRMSGKLATFPIYGNGTYTSSFYNITVQYNSIYDLKKMDDGEVYMMFYHYDCDVVPQHVATRLENLFNGNQLLGEAMNSFLNENWRLAYSDLAKDISLAVGYIVFSIFKESAKTVPFNEIFYGVE